MQVGDAVACPQLVEPAVVENDEIPVDVHFQDSELLVVEKPAGLPCHPLRAGERRTLLSALLARYPQLSGVGDDLVGADRRELGLVHRLDTDTSGLVLVALSTRSLLALRSQLRRGAMDKHYVARCRPVNQPGGELPPDVRLGPLDAHLLADHRRRVRVFAVPRPFSRPIVTVIEALQPQPDGSMLVHCAVQHAGRHQVRAHLAALGLPLLGDTLYGGPERDGGHLLHATVISCRHPLSGQLLRVESPLPARFFG